MGLNVSAAIWIIMLEDSKRQMCLFLTKQLAKRRALYGF